MADKRRLAHIEYVHHVTLIEGADKIELAHILGWQCAVNKGQFNVGDLGVYFEIDSFLPIDERYDFLKTKCYKNSPILGEGYKIRTIKMKGELSQGLLFPLSAFPEIPEDLHKPGTDVTDILKIQKWEIEERGSTQGTIIGELPGFMHKTHEERIQNVPDIIDSYQGAIYYITTKMDGTSCSIGIDENNDFYVCGHNYQYADDGKSSFYEWVKSKNLPHKLNNLKYLYNHKSIVLQGEFCGGGIQKNPLKLKNLNWYIFTVDVDGLRATLEMAQEIAHKLELDFVPVEETGRHLKSKYPDVESLLKRAEGKYDSGEVKEGIVVRTYDGELSFKAINNEYLLKEK